MIAERLGPLRSREFRMLFGAQTSSLLGDNILNVAIVFAVLGLRHSPADVGFVLVARNVPMVAFVLIGGVWADRVRRQRLMMAADLARFAAQGLMAALFISGRAQLWEVMLLEVVHGAGNGVFRPAATGLVPQTVPTRQLQAANALLMVTMSFGQIVGPAFSGVLIALTSPGWGIAIDSLSFAISALFLLGMRVERLVVAERRSFLFELSAGWREVRSRRWLLISLGEFAVFQAAVYPSLFVLGPAVATIWLGGPVVWGTLMAVFGAGGLLGGALALRVTVGRPLAAAFLMLGGLGIPLLTLAGLAPLPAIAAAMLFGGGALTFGDTLWSTVLQSRIPDAIRSRVAAYDWLGSSLLYPVGLATVGPVAEVVGLRTTLAGAGLVLLATSALVAASPDVRRLTGTTAERPEPVH